MISKIKRYIKVLNEEVVMAPQLIKYLFSFKQKAIYVGCTRMGNLGDEVIFYAIKNSLKNHLFIYEIPYNAPKAGRLLRKWVIRKPDFILLGGGTIIKKGAKESYLKIINDQIELYPNARLAVLGPGAADDDFAQYFGLAIDQKSWKTFLDKCDFVSVRGVLSKKQLQKWNIVNEVNLFHDPAIFYAKDKMIPKSKNKKIGINFAFIGHKIYGENPQLVEQFAKGIVASLIGEGWNVYLYPTTKSDLEYMLETIGLKEFKEISVYKNYKDINKSINFMETMDVFLGQRLHSIIFAANAYTPFHAIEYEPKTSDFLLTTGFENYSTRTDSLNVIDVIKRINNLYSSIDEEQQIVFKLMQEAKKQQKECIQKLLNIIK